MIKTAVKKEGTDLGLAYKTALRLLDKSYQKGKIFSGLSKTGDPLSELEIISILALSPRSRKEIISKYLYSGKIHGITTTGILAWAVINVLDEFGSSEKVTLEKYFTKCEEYFDCKVNVEGLLPAEAEDNWLKTSIRTGILIENQAYHAKILDVLFLLTGDDMYEFKKKRLIRAVRNKLDGAYVLDREGSLEIRPNVFIAAFFSPELFKKDDWQKTFDVALKESELWKSWGGLITLGRSDANYNAECDDKSWFFVNNIAALVLSRLDSVKYAEKIQRILKASTENVFWQKHSERPCEVTFSDKQIMVQGLYGLSLATYVYLYRTIGSN